MLQEVNWSLLNDVSGTGKGRCHNSRRASQCIDLAFPWKLGDQKNEVSSQPIVGTFGKVKWYLTS